MVLRYILKHVKESKHQLSNAKRRMHELIEQKRLHALKIKKINSELERLHESTKKLEAYLKRIKYA